MALDFPNAPTLNQTFTAPNGVIWVWDGVKWTATTSTSPFTGQGNVGRNLLHNPLFNVAQRGAGPFTASGNRTADRWGQWLGTGDTVSTVINATDDGARSQIGDEAATQALYLPFTGAAGAANLVLLQQNMEGVRRLSGKTVTVSFWAATSAGSLKVGVSIDQGFGTGGSPSATVPGVGQSITVTPTWTRYSVTRTIPSASGKTVGTNGDDITQCNIWLSAGANYASASGSVGVQSGGIAFWGVQLEVGSVATPLEKPDPRYDLSNCQRFFQVTNASLRVTANAAGNIVDCTVSWPLMRATPTVTLSLAGINSNVTTPALTPQYAASGRFEFSSAAAGDAYALAYFYNLSADL